MCQLFKGRYLLLRLDTAPLALNASATAQLDKCRISDSDIAL
jgi:hypothetical protein